jgi:hypothetical protein
MKNFRVGAHSLSPDRFLQGSVLCNDQEISGRRDAALLRGEQRRCATPCEVGLSLDVVPHDDDSATPTVSRHCGRAVVYRNVFSSPLSSPRGSNPRCDEPTSRSALSFGVEISYRRPARRSAWDPNEAKTRTQVVRFRIIEAPNGFPSCNTFGPRGRGGRSRSTSDDQDGQCKRDFAEHGEVSSLCSRVRGCFAAAGRSGLM